MKSKFIAYGYLVLSIVAVFSSGGDSDSITLGLILFLVSIQSLFMAYEVEKKLSSSNWNKHEEIAKIEVKDGNTQ